MSAANHQIRAADPGRSVFVTANAGSGKTTTLVNRVARLLLKGVEPGQILCVTYTKAAAAEMQARLFDQLGGWAVLDDAALAAEVAALDGGDASVLTGEDLSRARRLFAKALETPGGLKIQTIHAFCEKLLRRFPLEAGVSPRFTVLENEAATALSHGARETLAREALKAPDGPLGLAYSHFAVALDWGRFEALLAMIEAERGKLTDYVERVEKGKAPGPYQLTGADPDLTTADIEAGFMNRIGIEAWRAAAEAMATGSVSDQKVSANMALALHVWSFAALEPVFLTDKGEARKSIGTKKTPPETVAWLSEMQLAFLSVREQLASARIAEDTVRVLTLARVHAAFYEQAKQAKGALDFSDLVARTVDLLTKHGTAAWVLYKLDGGIEHVLIDEAQDTAPDQWAIMRALTGEFFAGEPRGRTVFAVGDEKQSIYSFQGARPERLRQEAQVYDALVTGAGGVFEGVPLDVSYRSTEEVLAFVDAVFEGPDKTRALVGDTGEIATHQPSRVGQHGAIDLWPIFTDQPAGETDVWAPLDVEAAQSGRKQLAATLAQEIKRQVETGVAVYAKTRPGEAPVLKPCGYGDFLVLVRRRDATFEEIIRALKSAGVPVAGADRLKLSSHVVFDDLIALARFALFPGDDLSLAEVLRSPLCDVDEAGLYDLAGRDKRKGLWRELRDRADERPEWGRARDLMLAALAVRDCDPFGFFAGILNRVDDTGRSGRARILVRLGREAEEAIDETLAQVLAAEGRGGIDLESCVALLEAADVEVKRELEGARAEVRVMTVHGAKGLEAPVVMLPDTTMRAKPQGPSLMPVETDDGEAWLMCPGAERDDCPASAAARQARKDRTDAETLRLLYVALTRARDRVIVMGRRSATREPEVGSWWSVITDTFGRLEQGGKVRTLERDVRRFGVDPVVMVAGVAVRKDAVSAADWARERPAADPSARLPSPLASGAGGLGRFRRGDLIHRLLERLPEIDPSERAAAAGRILAREPDLTDDQRAEMTAAAFGVLNDQVFAEVFGPGSRAEAALAGALAGGLAVSGRIDRLVLTPDRVLVVDYKTNRPAPDRIEDADPAYVAQMAVYVALLKQLWPERSVEAALVWTDGPRLMAVPQALMDGALADIQ
jgi:ATP-dependent helicase/nuclease subunit A